MFWKIEQGKCSGFQKWQEHWSRTCFPKQEATIHNREGIQSSRCKRATGDKFLQYVHHYCLQTISFVEQQRPVLQRLAKSWNFLAPKK